MVTLNSIRLRTLIASALALTGCATPNNQASNLYSLATGIAATRQPCAISFSIRDLRLAGYLDRAEVVVGRDGTSVSASAQSVWAAPLKDEIRRMLSRDLALRWDGSRLVAYPWRFGETPEVAIDVSIDALDPLASGLRAIAFWQILKLADPGNPRSNPQLLKSGSYSRLLPMTRGDAAATAETIGTVLEHLADEIAGQASGNLGLAALCARR